jgi:hypothetical protein
MSTTYKVYFTPKTDIDAYGDEVEVTDFVLETGVSQLRRGIDSTDYSIGVFFYDDVKLKLVNVDVYLNDETDYRSLFTSTRDMCKVRIVFEDDDGTTIVFRGLINEEATRIDVTKDEIEFRVLSRDSVLRNTKVTGGSITNGVLASSAFLAILNVPEITSVLGVDAANINPANDITIDDGSELENRNVRDALNELLLATNSIMLLDEDDNITIQDRGHNTDTDILVLYGAYDLKRRQNIIDIKNYNLGKHRMFTSIMVNDEVRENEGYVEQFGFKQKNISLDFITTAATEINICNDILDEFKAPKIELEVTVPTRVARNVRPLDRVSIDSPLRLQPPTGKFFPVIGSAVIDDALTPLPYSFGSVSIPAELGFKVIEIKEDPRTFETTLKLRQIGTESGDGFFTSDTCGVIGFAVIGTGTICDEGDIADGFNPSVIGAAIVGYTEVA